MSLIRSAQLNGHDPQAYLKDILTRLPGQRQRGIAASSLTEVFPQIDLDLPDFVVCVLLYSGMRNSP